MIDKRIGNQFWKARAKHGRSKIFSSPNQLWKAAIEYFDKQNLINAITSTWGKIVGMLLLVLAFSVFGIDLSEILK